MAAQSHSSPAGVEARLQEVGKAPTHHRQSPGFLHTPFFLTTAGALVLKKLAIETGAPPPPAAAKAQQGHACRV